MRKILVLSPHDLVLDPRIKWMAESLSSFFEVHAIGLNEKNRSPQFKEGIKTTQLIGVGSFFKGISWLASLIPLSVKFILGFILLLLLPLALIIFALKRIPGTNLFQRRSSLNGYLFDIYFLFYVFKSLIVKNAIFISHFEKKSYSGFEYVLANDLDTLLPAVYLKKTCETKIVYDAHEFYPFQFPGASLLLTKPIAILEKCLLSQVSDVITVTPQLAEEMRNYYKLSKEIYAIPNCSPIEVQKSGASKENVKKIFLFQGMFAPGRGIETLINSWLKLNPANATLVLRGPENDYRKYCESLVKDLSSSIVFDEPVLEDDLIKAAAKADVGVIPYEPTSVNNMNCCPNKLSQYLQSGIAVLANDLPFVSEILTRSKAGLIYNSKIPGSFQACVEKMINDESFLTKSKLNAKNFSHNEYHWGIVSDSVIKKVFNVV